MPTQVKVGWRSFVSPVASSYLLDSYSSAAAAYSLRKLRTAYTGNAMRVRRSSDNGEQNIGFDANGNLDTESLLSFVGAGNGFVTTWYDQSGNVYNAYQSTAINQPLIVSSGLLTTNGGKPAIRCVSGTGLLINQISLGTTHSMFAVIDWTSGNREYFGSFGNSWAFYQVDGEYKANGAFGRTNASFTTNRFLGTLLRVNTQLQYYQNSTTLGSPFTINSNNSFNLSNLIGEDYNWGFAGDQQEAIIYTSSMASSRIGIESNINSYYSIYSTLDTDAQAFVTAAGITDATQVSAVNTLVTSLKSANIWTKMKALYPFVGGTATSHKFNLKDPRDLDAAFRLQFNGGWTHTSTGATPNGTTGYANTYLNPYVVFGNNQNTLPAGSTHQLNHMSKYIRNNIITSKYRYEGVFSNSGTLLCDMTIGWDTFYGPNGGATINGWAHGQPRSFVTLGNRTDGFFVVNRDGYASLKSFRNNTLISTNTTDIRAYNDVGLQSNLNPNQVFFIGARNDAYDYNIHPNNYHDYETAFQSIGWSLTDAETTALNTAVQAFQTSLGRQV
jgi:hypothetical protein